MLPRVWVARRAGVAVPGTTCRDVQVFTPTLTPWAPDPQGLWGSRVLGDLPSKHSISQAILQTTSNVSPLHSKPRPL